MAKKISENELNNVSGGCALDHYESEVGCFESSGHKIGGNIFTKSAKTIEEADKILDEKCAELFAADSRISYIRWRMNNKYNNTQKTGIKYR